MTTTADIREQVRLRYAAAATAVQITGANALAIVDGDQCCGPASAVDPAVSSCCGSSGEVDEAFGAGLYTAGEQDELPVEAVIASLGCGNPIAVADLHPGERVLDLGSGGGIDVLLSARRVGETGFAYGVDMTDEMFELARANQAKAGPTNVEFLKGTIENVPLPDASVDVVISNCVINLSTDKPAVHRRDVPRPDPGRADRDLRRRRRGPADPGRSGRARLLRRLHRRRAVEVRIPRRAGGRRVRRR